MNQPQLSEHAKLRLQWLFGVEAHIENVRVGEDVVDFILDTNAPFNSNMGVNASLHTLVNGKLECQITINSLDSQVRLLAALTKATHP